MSIPDLHRGEVRLQEVWSTSLSLVVDYPVEGVPIDGVTLLPEQIKLFTSKVYGCKALTGLGLFCTSEAARSVADERRNGRPRKSRLEGSHEGALTDVATSHDNGETVDLERSLLDRLKVANLYVKHGSLGVGSLDDLLFVLLPTTGRSQVVIHAGEQAIFLIDVLVLDDRGGGSNRSRHLSAQICIYLGVFD